MSGQAGWTQVDALVGGTLLGDDPALQACLSNSASHGLPDIAVSGAQARFLELIAKISGARRVLEVGTLGAYSTIHLARGVGDSGHVTTLELDLEQAGFPAGPWDLLISSHYLQRSLFPLYPEQLSPGGILICLQPTLTNLERHPKPSARFLLQPEELPGLVPDLEILHYREGWLEGNRHEAILAARKPHDPG